MALAELIRSDRKIYPAGSSDNTVSYHLFCTSNCLQHYLKAIIFVLRMNMCHFGHDL